MTTPTISHPTNRPNYAEVQVGRIRYAFSYRTCIGAAHPEHGVITRENVWGPTTGRHLNYWDDGRKAERMPEHVFSAILAEWQREDG